MPGIEMISTKYKNTLKMVHYQIPPYPHTVWSPHKSKAMQATFLLSLVWLGVFRESEREFGGFFPVWVGE